MKRLALLLLPLVTACSEATGSPTGTGGGGGDSPGDAGIDLGDAGAPLVVNVPEEGRVFVELSTPAVVTTSDVATTKGWDLALEGLDVYTNSGPSGPGDGAGFGPLAITDFRSDTVPEIPFVLQDKTGGAFVGWYAYEGATHALWSRYHVYGVREQDRLWKVQILGYYGELAGAPVSALYSIRYAEVVGGSVGPTKEIQGLDGTAGGSSAPEGTPAECFDLGTEKRVLLTPDEARASKAWHLCFRRDSISVNGELGGPRGVTAVDLDAEKTASETIEALQKKTAASEKPRFDAVTAKELDDSKLVYRGDRVVSAFSDHWIEPGTSPLTPALATWVAVGADGKSNFLVVFEKFDGPTASSPGAVTLRIKSVE